MTPKDNMLRVIRHDRPAWVPCGLENALREIEFDAVEWPPGPGTDVWGVQWDMNRADVGAYPVGHPLPSLEAMGEHAFPDFATTPYSAQGRAWLAAPDRAEFLVMGRVGETLFERAWMLMGMEQLMLAIYENPEGLKALIARIAAVRAVMIDRHIAAGCEAVIFADDYGGQDSLLLSPEAWREFIKPDLARLYAQCKAAGLMIVQHSCGQIAAILPDMVDMGLDVWHPCQPTSNDLAALKQQFAGRLTFYGAVNSYVLDRGTPEEVRREVRLRLRQLAAGGGFIAAPSHGVPYPPENLAAMEAEIRRAGRYGSKDMLSVMNGG
jgi:uroporphyrinogen decarboxylase